MVQHTNFYETLKEAEMRLVHTAVLYDGEPYIVLAITNHKPDGIFRVYLDPFPTKPGEMMHHQAQHVPYEWCDEPNMTRGQKLDQYIEQTKGCPIIRKNINSPLFQKFRPFPLGMCNVGNGCYYLTRGPTRHTQQGLMDNSISQFKVSLLKEDSSGRKGYNNNVKGVAFYSSSFRDVVKGVYPSLKETVEAFSDPTVTNEAVGFSRDFAIVKGPMNILFLDYKQDVIGYLPNGDLSKVILGREFKHTKEVVEELNAFSTVTVKA